MRLLIVAAIGAAGVGASWAIAANTVSDVLGEPPPDTGKSHLTMFWQGTPALRDHARAWLFAYTGTRIPGASTVRIYVSPTGKLLRVEPTDLAYRLKAMHRDF